MTRLIPTSLLLAACLAVSAAGGEATQSAGGLLVAQVSTLYGKREPSSITIVIKPGSASNAIPIKTERVFPIAILGSADLDITLVNPRTIRIEAAAKKLVGRSDTRTCRRADINADNHPDLICDIKTVAFRLDPGELVLTLIAETYERQPLQGEGTIRIVDE